MQRQNQAVTDDPQDFPGNASTYDLDPSGYVEAAELMRESRRLEQVQADLLSANRRLVDDTERFHASELHQLRERLDDQVRQLESDCESVRDDREHLVSDREPDRNQ